MSAPQSPIDGNPETLSESAFLALAEALLARVESLAENATQDIDVQRSGNVLNIELEDGHKLVVNLQTPMREVWLAARTGGFHYRYAAGSQQWLDTRSNAEFFSVLLGFFNS